MAIVKEVMKEIITNALSQAQADNVLPEGELPDIKIEYPKEDKFGDYATPLALESARVLRKSPFEIGELLKKYIEQSDIVEKVDVVKPGFINIFVSLDFLTSVLHEIDDTKDAYGKRQKTDPRKINLEFVSANPTGPLNIVSARAAALGDTLANILEANGDVVDREYYINDFGNQVRLLGISVLARYREQQGEQVAFPEDGYQGEYVKDIAEHIADTHASEIAKFDDEEALVEFFSDKAIASIVAGQKKVMEQFNVEYQNWFSEKELHKNGDVENALKALEEKSVIYEEENKKVFRATNFGDDKDRVVVRDDGRPTYLLADIAYHNHKFERGYTDVIDIWGPDHHGYIARLKGAINALGHDEEHFKVLIAQQVNLLMEGELVKMSKRLGQFSTMQDLIDEIGVDVARYFFVMRSLESHLDFDLDLAKKQSSENPVFYLQYAHARICSLFNEAEKRGITYDAKNIDNNELHNKEAITVLKLLIKFPDEVIDAAESLEPHRIANYLLKLAQSYHKFYAEHRILTDDHSQSNTYLSLCDAVRIVLKNGLALLGVSAPDRM